MASVNSQIQKTGNTASKNQLKFISKLISEHEIPKSFLETMRRLWRQKQFTTKVASAFITEIHKMPYKPGVRVSLPNSDLIGYHRVGNEIYRVRPTSNGSRNLVSHRVLRNSRSQEKLVYAPEAVNFVNHFTKIS